LAHERRIAVIGLGYVGLPVAVAFALSGADVTGFDIDRTRISDLRSGIDRTGEIDASDLQRSGLRFTDSQDDLRDADFFIVTVPTPIDAARRPDLTALLKATETVGRALKRGDVVVYESTVYPGATEEDCLPLLEHVSGLRGGVDFHVGYSPERINPGDREHRLETVVKIVSGQDGPTLDLVAAVYGSICHAGVHRAPSIRVAEAAKVIENAQRDINIAFMNELSLIFHELGIDTGDVLAAARTKWNFLPFSPGLVGGHCIGVDPYYLTHRAERAGCHPEVILAGRRTNDGVGTRVARECVRALFAGGRSSRPRVAVLGITFKENVPDLRNSKAVDIVRELQSFGVEVDLYDPVADPAGAQHEYGLTCRKLGRTDPADAVVLAVPHRAFVEGGWPLVTSFLRQGGGPVFDVRGVLDRAARPADCELWRL
jgi:UDP-N-acetyl-D-galactosamine dehydrogenase